MRRTSTVGSIRFHAQSSGSVRPPPESSRWYERLQEASSVTAPQRRWRGSASRSAAQCQPGGSGGGGPGSGEGGGGGLGSGMIGGRAGLCGGVCGAPGGVSGGGDGCGVHGGESGGGWGGDWGGGWTGGGMRGPGGGCSARTLEEGANWRASSFGWMGAVQSLARRPPVSTLLGSSEEKKKP